MIMSSKPITIVVDENDKIVGYKDRSLISSKEFYRVTALWITNSAGEALLARRSYNKRHHPGFWGPAAAGTVEKGESYEDNIIKEAEEELGLKNTKFELGPKIRVEDEYSHFTQWFFCKLDKPLSYFTIQEDEVAEIRWFKKDEALKMIKDKEDKFLLKMKYYFDHYVDTF